MLGDESPFVQKLAVGERSSSAGVVLVEHAPIPMHGHGIVKLLGAQSVDNLAVVRVVGSIPEKPLDLRPGATFVAGPRAG